MSCTTVGTSSPARRRAGLARLCRAGRWLLLGLAGTSIPGCTLLSVLAYQTSDDPVIPAQYVLPKRPTLILVDHFENPAAVRLDANRLAENVSLLLKEHEIGPLVVSDKLLDMRSADPYRYRRLGVAAIGRSVGAEQVVFVDLQAVTVEQALGSDQVKATAVAHISVIDSATGETRWPKDSSTGYPLTIQTPYALTGGDEAESALHNKLAQNMGEQIARLFYKWKKSEGSVDNSEPAQPEYPSP